MRENNMKMAGVRKNYPKEKPELAPKPVFHNNNYSGLTTDVSPKTRHIEANVSAHDQADIIQDNIDTCTSKPFNLLTCTQHTDQKQLVTRQQNIDDCSDTVATVAPSGAVTCNQTDVQKTPEIDNTEFDDEEPADMNVDNVTMVSSGDEEQRVRPKPSPRLSLLQKQSTQEVDKSTQDIVDEYMNSCSESRVSTSSSDSSKTLSRTFSYQSAVDSFIDEIIEKEESENNNNELLTDQGPVIVVNDHATGAGENVTAVAMAKDDNDGCRPPADTHKQTEKTNPESCEDVNPLPGHRRAPPPPLPAKGPVGFLTRSPVTSSRESSPHTQHHLQVDADLTKSHSPPRTPPKPSKRVIEQARDGIMGSSTVSGVDEAHSIKLPTSISTPNISRNQEVLADEVTLRKDSKSKHHKSSVDVQDKRHSSVIQQFVHSLSKIASENKEDVEGQDKKRRNSSLFYFDLEGKEQQDVCNKKESRQWNLKGNSKKVNKKEKRKSNSNSVFYCGVNEGGTLKFEEATSVIDFDEDSKTINTKNNESLKHGDKKLSGNEKNKEKRRSRDRKSRHNSDDHDACAIDPKAVLAQYINTECKKEKQLRKIPTLPPKTAKQKNFEELLAPAAIGKLDDADNSTDGSMSPVAPPRTKRRNRSSQVIGMKTSNSEQEMVYEEMQFVEIDAVCDHDVLSPDLPPRPEDFTRTSIVRDDSGDEGGEEDNNTYDIPGDDNVYDDDNLYDVPSVLIEDQPPRTVSDAGSAHTTDNAVHRTMPSLAELESIYMPMSPGKPPVTAKGWDSMPVPSTKQSSDTLFSSGEYAKCIPIMPLSARQLDMSRRLNDRKGQRPSSWAAPDSPDGGMAPLDTSQSTDSDNSDDSEGEFNLGDIMKSLKDMKDKLDKNKMKSFYAAREIMTTEERFVAVLKLINEDFRNHVISAKGPLGGPVIPVQEVDKFLKYLPLLQNFSEDLLRDLKARMEKWDESQKIADVFVKKGPFLKMYTVYIREFESLCSTLEDCRKRFPGFDKAVTEFEISPKCSNMAIKHYMLKPIQRIPQYRLLLKEYLKYLADDSEDYEDTKAALDIVSEVADHANRSMAFTDNQKKLVEIQENLIGDFEVVKPGRLLVKSGIIQKICRKVMQPRMFFLFSDTLLVTKPLSTGYRYQVELLLDTMKVSKPTKDDFANELSVISTVKSFRLSASTPEEREEWLTALQDTINEFKKKKYSYLLQTNKSGGQAPVPDGLFQTDGDFMLGHQAPAWVPDSRVSMCVKCHEEFTLTFRRHHCRACGKVFCGPCSDNRAPLRYQSYKPGRVCMDCFLHLKKDCEGWLINLERSGQDKNAVHAVKEVCRGFIRGSTQGYGTLWNSFGLGKHKRASVLEEVKATTDDADMSGYMQTWENKRWKRIWFVLKDKVLYYYRASEDTAASKSIPLIGFQVQRMDSSFQKAEADSLFQISHKNVSPSIFKTENEATRERWLKYLSKAVLP